MFYIYWDGELVSAVCGIDEVIKEMKESHINGSDLFYGLFSLGHYSQFSCDSLIQMSDGSKHLIHIQVYYCADHLPHGHDFPF